MRKYIFLLLTILIVGLEGFSQANPGFDIAGNLQSFFSSHSFENAYLQFDKPYYAAGDTIYFKAYVTQGEQHKPTDLSGVLHVDLINPENKIDHSILLLISSGITWGDFALPDSLPAGNYRVRAYTRLMRNNGEKDFFDRIITIGALKSNEVSQKQTQPKPQEKNNKPSLQFFPEGGNLVAGLASKVAFKAIDPNGLGIGVKGTILDNTNKEVGQFASTHLGMGYFLLNPEEGKTYQAKVTFADGTQNTVDLPMPEASGITLSLNNDSIQKTGVKIEANAAFFKGNQNKNFPVLIYSEGTAVTVNCELDTSFIEFGILNRLLHTGVTTITLFSPDGLPLCERLLFIKNKSPLNLQIQSGKKSYSKREKVSLGLMVKNDVDSTVTGHFSVSVIDENKVPQDVNNEHTILTDLLLTSEVKGYVEQPNYYFNDTSEAAIENLDVLMLTQGYRRFEWKQVMDNNYDSLAFEPEKALDINGKITNLSGIPIPNGTVTLIPPRGSSLLSAVSGPKGLFHFSNLVFADTTHFVLSAVNSVGRNSTKITYFNNEDKPAILNSQQSFLPFVKDKEMQVYLENANKYQEEMAKYRKVIVLKEVKARGIVPNNQYHTQSLTGAGNADQVVFMNQIEKIKGQLSNILNGRLHGVSFSVDTPYIHSPTGVGAMLVVIDGGVANMKDINGYILPFGINDIPSSEVESVEVLKYASASMYGMEGENGVLVINTKQGGSSSNSIASVGILPIIPKGFHIAREFYSPKYDHTNGNSKQPDLRSTIYWKPEIKTGKDGNASFDYYNADGTGTYKVTVEGIDENGDIGRAVYRYKVE